MGCVAVLPKDCGLENLPFKSFDHNEVWLWLVMLAQDLIAWTQQLLLATDARTWELKRLRYHDHGHHPNVVAEHRARAPWYPTKTTPSFADTPGKVRRVIIAAQYHPGTSQTPTPAQITDVQHAWGAAGL